MLTHLLRQLQWTDVIDVGLVAAFIWAAFSWLRHTRSRLALIGVVLLSAVYLAARQLELQLTVWVLQGFFAVLVFVLVVVFQDDLRRIFEQIAVWGLRRQALSVPMDAVSTLVRAVEHQTRHRQGALYVIPGREPLDRHLEGGIALDARISEPLLLSLFDHHSPGHDGAVVINGSRVSRFAVHLPLSTSHDKIPGGTRHAAALGLAERTDALAVVVSEERGVVSVTHDGELRQLAGAEQLGGEIHRFLEEVSTGGRQQRSWRELLRRWPEALAATLLAAGLWAALVFRADDVEVMRPARVVVENLPQEYRLEAVEPEQVEVKLLGPWRLLPDESEELELRIDALLVELGRRTFRVTPAHVEQPDGVLALDVEPDSVRLSVERVAGEPRSP